MKITSSYGVELRHIGKMLNGTIEIYRKALAYLIDVVNKEWDAASAVKGVKKQVQCVEKWIHTTKSNMAKYDFDQRFYKMPSYLRRAVIAEAIGAVSSYRSNYANWEAAGKIGKEPKLTTDRHSMPVFYRDNMYLEGDEAYTAKLKLLVNNDWVWVPVSLLPTDINYLKKYWSNCDASAPALEKKHGKYFLRFSFEEKVALSDTPINEQKICSVDLGINTDAVCSIMCADGTILARKFINFTSDKDQVYTVLNRIKRFQREHGSKDVGSLWRYAARLNEEHAIKVANAIVSFATEHFVHCIVFEHLSMNGKKRGSRKQRLQMWRKNYIQEVVTHKAHRLGMRISRICAWKTSQLAFDGSGPVQRDEDNYSLCTFSSGKRYNCDLSASYNIGARYFIRELLKSPLVTAGSDILTKVPDARRRTSCTLATLLRLNEALACL